MLLLDRESGEVSMRRAETKIMNGCQDIDAERGRKCCRQWVKQLLRP